MNSVNQQLHEISGRLNRWQALRLAGWCVAAALAAWLVVGLADLWMRPESAVIRWLLALPIFAVMMAGLVFLGRTLIRKRTPAATAARLEYAFPELDNRLINRVLFAAIPEPNSWQLAYLRQPLPSFVGLPWERLQDRPGRQRAWLAAFAAGLLLATPLAFTSKPWTTALHRTIAPWSDVAPWSWATLVDVKPGAATITQGEALEITGIADGKPGQEIRLEIRQPQNQVREIKMGEMTANTGNAFRFRLTGMTGSFDYRVRAGDAAPSARFPVTVLPPPALAAVLVKIVPPAGLPPPPGEIDALKQRLSIPQYALVTLWIRANRPATAVSVGIDAAPPIAFSAGSNDNWIGAFKIVAGREFHIVAETAMGKISETLPFTLENDRSPVLRIVYPAATTTLGPGATPEIRFEAGDDRGLAQVFLESVAIGTAETLRGEVVKAWKGEGKTMKQIWKGEIAKLQPGRVYRVVAEDNCAAGTPQRTVSRPIVFASASVRQLLDQERRDLAALQESLEKLIERQKANLVRTTKQLGTVPRDAAPEWTGIRDEQQELRTAVGRLMEIATPTLDSVQPILDVAWKGPMLDVIGLLDRIPNGDVAARRQLGQNTLDQERRILDMLLRAEAALVEAARHQQAVSLLALIDGLVKEQESIIAATAAIPAAGKVPPTLPGRQDKLAGDFTSFTEECRKTARQAQGAERDFGPVVLSVADRADALKIKNKMLAAAEMLEQGTAAPAIDPENLALNGLKELQLMMNRWRAADATKTAAQMVAALNDAKEKMEQMVATQDKLVKELRSTTSQDDKSRGDFKEFEAQYREAKKEMADKALTIATDLQVLPDLPVGNKLVEDLYQTYEEMKQAAGSESSPVSELGLQKEDWILDELKKEQARLDDMEMWMVSKPDNVKRDIENFDLQEMPKIAMTDMPDAMQDIIGDLLEQEEKLSKEADDSTGNQGTADLPAGWGIAEGEFTSYGAKGMSGNERPEHKDQDGRSGIGREGMADGEAVEASGSIKEGDKNIEKRMTRDSSQGGQIKEESEAKAVATGGGKLGGTADERGMAGAGPRRDAPTNQQSMSGAQDQLRRQAEALYAKASMGHLRTGQLGTAVNHMRQAEDALNSGVPIRQVREYQRRAVGALQATKADLDAGLANVSLGKAARAGSPGSGVSAGTDEAPAGYQEMVSEYFKAVGTQE